jgi:hypothetical protein
MKRKALAPIAFPIENGPHSTFILGTRVHASGFIEMTGLLRMPYQNRPRYGGGIAIPYSALNVTSKVKTREHVKRVLNPGFVPTKRQRKAFKPWRHIAVCPELGTRRHENNA